MAERLAKTGPKLYLLNRRLSLRILHIIHQYLPERIGGTELYTRTLAQYQATAGDSPAIFVPSTVSAGWPEPVMEDGVRVYRFPVGTRAARRVFFDTFGQRKIDAAFDQVLAQEKPDLVHIQHLMGLPVSIANRLARGKVPYIVTLHDYWYLCANAQLLTNYDNTICDGPNWWLNCGRCALVRAGLPQAKVVAPAIAPIMAARNKKLQRVLAKANLLIAPTNFVRQTYAGLGVPEDKIRVIPHGIKLPHGNVSRPEKKDLSLAIVYIGGISRQKGLHVLVEAVNQLPEEDFQLAIYGDESAFPDYAAQLKQQASHPGITFGGRLPHKDLWSVLANQDVLVTPSLWYETASLIVQEAFASGVPVVASDIGALKERVDDGINGILVPPGDIDALRDTLRQLQQEPARLARLRSGIKPVRTISEHARAVSRAYQSILFI